LEEIHIESSIKDKFTKEIFLEAAGRFGINFADTIELDGFQNFVFLGKRDSIEVILRIAHSSHRSKDMTLAEIEFISYLADSGMTVSKAIRSNQGEYVEVIEQAENSFVVTAFEFAPGRRAEICVESDIFYERIGRFTGKMHKLSKQFSPIQKRYDWNDNASLTKFQNYVPNEMLQKKLELLISQIQSLSRDRDSFGLIHGDISPGNYLNHEDHPSIIDFDQCEYSWFASEIATSIFHETPIPFIITDENTRKAIAKRFFSNFFQGYSKENTLSLSSLEAIPLFINLRQAIVIGLKYRSFDMGNFDNWSDFSKEALTFNINNLINDIPFIDLDITSL
jgi:Ser/Thr protein kinase RdoA (MazF antagonist)